jgi:predicted ATPase
MTRRLQRITVKGFRSLRDVTLSDLGPVTVLIGPNGSGKSNLLGVVQMLRMLAFGSLQLFVGRNGGASFLLHYGPRTTPEMVIELEFQRDDEATQYTARLVPAAGESLLFQEERIGHRKSIDDEWNWVSSGGHREALVAKGLDSGELAGMTRDLLQGLNFYHFHDTSLTSELRTHARREDDRYLQSSGSNLAAFLLRLKTSTRPEEQAAFRQIEGMLRQIAPFLRALEPTEIDAGAVRLDWVDDRNERFGAAHLSDGTLRALALFTALGQPVQHLPSFCVIDEPELGLHPAALDLFCELVRSASAHCQILLATQSPALLDHFEAHEVVVTERKDHATAFRRLDAEELAGWLEEYTLSDLYNMNVLGGRP